MTLTILWLASLPERIVLNARDAGLTLQATNSSAPDIRVVRVPIISLDAHIALDGAG